MDDRTMHRLLCEAPRPEFRQGHESRLHMRLSRGRARWWRAAAALIAISGALYGIGSWPRRGAAPVGGVVVTGVHWDPGVRRGLLDVSRWSHGGFVSPVNERPERREGVEQ